MYKLKTVALLIVSLILIFLFTSCSMVETEQGDVIKAYCENMIDAVLADDAETAYAVLTDGVDKENFLSNFSALHEYTAGVDTYELVQKGWYTGVKNGTSYYEATFEMKTNAETYFVTGTTVEGYERLYSFNIVSSSESDLVFTGTLTTLSGANPIQWGMLLISAAFLVFVIFMLVDCCKRKIKWKPLWIILIIAGALVLTASYGDGNIKFNVNLGLFLIKYSYLKLYTSGNFVFQFVIPFGAILYYFIRKKITLKIPPVQETNTELDTICQSSQDTMPKTDNAVSDKDTPDETQRQ